MLRIPRSHFGLVCNPAACSTMLPSPQPVNRCGGAGESGGQRGNGRFRHRGDVACGGRSEALAVVGQYDGQVVDVHRAVAGEFARAPGRPV